MSVGALGSPSNTYTSPLENVMNSGTSVGNSGGGSGSASDRSAAVAEATFQESLKARMISGLYAAAKEIRS